MIIIIITDDYIEESEKDVVEDCECCVNNENIAVNQHRMETHQAIEMITRKENKTKSFKVKEDILSDWELFCKTEFPQYQEVDIFSAALYLFMKKNDTPLPF